MAAVSPPLLDVTLQVDTAGSLQGLDRAGDVLLVEELSMASSTTSYSAPIPVINAAANLAADGSGTITAGGTAQNVFGGSNAITPANGFLVCNTSGGDLYISDVGLASGGGASIQIPVRSIFITPSGYKPAGPVSVWGTTTGQSFAARRW